MNQVKTLRPSEPHRARAPRVAIDLDVERRHPVLDVFVWPTPPDDRYLEAQFDLAAILNGFIDARSVPGGTLRPQHRRDLLRRLAAIRKVVDAAERRVTRMPDWSASHR